MMDVSSLTVEEVRGVIDWQRSLWNALWEEGTGTKVEEQIDDEDDDLIIVDSIVSSYLLRSVRLYLQTPESPI